MGTIQSTIECHREVQFMAEPSREAMKAARVFALLAIAPSRLGSRVEFEGVDGRAREVEGREAAPSSDLSWCRTRWAKLGPR